MELGLENFLPLFSAGVLAGGVNAIAGGGTFFTFPVLLSVGLPPVIANASNALAVWPGHAAAVPAYVANINFRSSKFIWQTITALFGGAIGALFLLATGDRLFSSLIPWLMLLATGIFAIGGSIRKILSRIPRTAQTAKFYISVEFLFAVYGGYFGAGLGILLMACLVITSQDGIHEINGLKNWLASIITTVAVAIFAFSGMIAWGPALVVMLGAAAGGYGGACLSHLVPQRVLRVLIILVGFALTAHYFYLFS